MKKWVSTQEKKSFLNWFLDNHRLKRTEARYLLEFLLKNIHILENVHFTDEIKPSRTTVIISSTNSDEVGFLFYKQNHRSEDVSKLMGDLLSDPTEKVFLLLHFFGKQMNNRYLHLFEDPLIENIRRYNLSEKYAKEAAKVLDVAIEDNRVEFLKKRIDWALDNKDKELFVLLSEELRQLEQIK